MIVKWTIYVLHLSIIFEQLSTVLTASSSNIRLIAGNKECNLFPNSNGRLEIFHNGEWGTVCNHGWDRTESTVACRTLGFKYGANAPPLFYGPGEGKIWMNNVNCTGEEDSLFNCQHAEFGQNNCIHEEDVNIWCSNDKVDGYVASSSGPSGSISWHCTTQVFDDVVYSWIHNCQRVGNTKELNPIKMSEKVHSSLYICDRLVNSTVRDIFRYYLYVNQPYSMRLIGDDNVDNGGRVEVWYDGEWGTVCDRVWNTRDSNEICKKLGFAYGEKVNISKFGEGDGLIWTPTMNCIGNDPSSMERCLFNTSESGCTHGNDVAVMCHGCGEEKWIHIEGLPPGDAPIYGFPGDVLKLKCRRSPCGNDSQITWANKYGGEIFKKDGDGNTTMTSFLNFTFSLSQPVMEIVCRQANKQSQTGKLITYYGPQRLEMSSEVTNVTGTKIINFKCIAIDAAGQLSFKWIIGDQAEVQTQKMEAEAKTITNKFSYALSYPEETFVKCTVTNPGVKTLEVQKKIVALIPYGPEKVDMILEEKMGTQSKRIKCSASESIGEITFKWFVNDKDVSRDATLAPTKEGTKGRMLRASIYITPSYASDESIVKCVVNNPGVTTIEVEKKLADIVSGGNNVACLSKWFLCFISFFVVFLKMND